MVCDHCGHPVRLEYRPNVNAVRWTHDEGWLGRWTCPSVNGVFGEDENGVPLMATVDGVQTFDAHLPIPPQLWSPIEAEAR